MGDEYRLAHTVQEDRRRRAAERRRARAGVPADGGPPPAPLRTRITVVVLLCGLAGVVALAGGQASGAAPAAPLPGPPAAPLPGPPADPLPGPPAAADDLRP